VLRKAVSVEHLQQLRPRAVGVDLQPSTSRSWPAAGSVDFPAPLSPGPLHSSTFLPSPANCRAIVCGHAGDFADWAPAPATSACAGVGQSRLDPHTHTWAKRARLTHIIVGHVQRKVAVGGYPQGPLQHFDAGLPKPALSHPPSTPRK
jgi:hypothetical protein